MYTARELLKTSLDAVTDELAGAVLISHASGVHLTWEICDLEPG